MLPHKAPVPTHDERPDALPEKQPAPEEKPASPDVEPALPGPTGTEEIPVPEQKPENADKPEASEKEPDKKPIPADPRSDLRPIDPMPKQEIACRERLKALGVEFDERKPIHDEENGCAVPYPLTVRALGSGIGLIPQAEMNCQMAEAAARFMVETVLPAAKAGLNANVKSVEQASAYVCRPRHNGQKMSEHAFGNALDIASFTLTDGTQIAVEPKPDEKPAKFLDDIRKAACGPFKTVLGPGSDADHKLHFHLDLEPRRNAGTFCQ